MNIDLTDFQRGSIFIALLFIHEFMPQADPPGRLGAILFLKRTAKVTNLLAFHLSSELVGPTKQANPALCDFLFTISEPRGYVS